MSQKDFILKNDDSSFRVRYQTSLTEYNDNEATFTIMSIDGLDDFEVQWAKAPYQEQTATIGQLKDLAVNQNLSLVEVDKGAETVLKNIGTAFSFVTSSPLPDGTDGASYSETIVAEGGSGERSNGSKPGDYTFAIDSGSLPSGLSLNSDTGEISGTPTETGTFTPTISCTDLYNQTITKQYSLTINA